MLPALAGYFTGILSGNPPLTLLGKVCHYHRFVDEELRLKRLSNTAKVIQLLSR